tara:strand:- start:34408 stop:35349 length:942 start_codon:yes stop_codon:yes gene_type:complete
MNAIAKYISQLQVGEPQHYQNLGIIPLFGKEGGLDYLTLDQAINPDLEQRLKITETREVPVLKCKNDTGKKILILPGDYLVGGSQNRMILNAILMDEQYHGNINVNCVEKNRWNHNMPKNFTSSSRRVSSSVRRASTYSQRETWSAVNNLAREYGTTSQTGDIDGTYEKNEYELEKYFKNFSFQPGAVGMVSVLKPNGNLIYHADIFDKSSTLQNNFEKILKSYALESLNGKKVKVSSEQVKSFLNLASKVNLEKKKGVSLGKETIFSNDKIHGNGLIYKKEPVYISLSTADKPQTEDVETGPVGLLGRLTRR